MRHKQVLDWLTCGLTSILVLLASSASNARACDCGSWLAGERREEILSGGAPGFRLVAIDIVEEPSCNAHTFPTCVHLGTVVEMCHSEGGPRDVVLTTVDEGCGADSLAPGRYYLAAEEDTSSSPSVLALRLGMCPVFISEVEYHAFCGGEAPPAVGCASCGIVHRDMFGMSAVWLGIGVAVALRARSVPRGRRRGP